MSTIDLSKPPYTVGCPECKAIAMAPCRSEERLPARLPQGVEPPGNVLDEPHDVRWTKWRLAPQLRVKVTLDTYVRWGSAEYPESITDWAVRMRIHCPTALNLHELFFFAAEKLDMSTTDYFIRYFPELVKKLHLNELAHQDMMLWNALLPEPERLPP